MGRKFVLGLLTVAGLVWTLTASAGPPAEFTRQAAWGGPGSGIAYPTALALAPNGHAFIANQRGDIWASEGFGQSTKRILDLRDEVHDYWDRGLLGLEVHPEYPDLPYLYALYAYGVPLDDRLPTHGDGCPDPPGGTADGCVVSGRLERFTIDPDTLTVVGDGVVMLNDWCQQFPSHSIADVEFGPDGALYVSAGDGANFNQVDYGQFGGNRVATPTPPNPCADPPGEFGVRLSAPTAEGGALRSQDLRTDGDPVTASGTVLRMNPLYDPDDPSSELALSDNPNIDHPDPIGKLVIAYGLRNPFRMDFDPDGKLYITDVGWNDWEEVNLHPDPTGEVINYGWPCYEGPGRQGGYDGANLDICEDLYDDEAANPGTVTFPLYTYHHANPITNASVPDDCPPATVPQGTTSAATGVAVYTSGNYPGEYRGALFGADHARNCIWVMYTDGNGAPDTSTIEVFDYGDGISPVDLQMGHDGNIYFVARGHHTIYRYLWTGENTPPVAVIEPSAISGDAPLEVTLDGSASYDPDGHDIVKYEWDLDGDGDYEDLGPMVTHTFGPGSHTVRLRVTDFPSFTSEVASVRIDASNSPPEVAITEPSETLTWAVGQEIEYSALGTDPAEGTLPGDRFTWELIIHHCTNEISCHEHLVWTRTGHSSGSFDAPDHGYPSHLELQVTVSDEYGVKDTDSVLIYPDSVVLTMASQPTGVPLSVVDRLDDAPFSVEVIVGSGNTISAPDTHTDSAGTWRFIRWLHGGDITQSIHAPASDTTYTAVFALPPIAVPLASPAGGAAPLEVDLDASGSHDPGGYDLVSYEWDLDGDDDFETEGQVVTHTFPAGTHQVALRVVNEVGLTSETATVTVEVIPPSFVDAQGHLFEGDIAWLASRGITRGCNPPANTLFCPDDVVTRGQMAAFFVRALGLSDAGAGDLFGDDDGHLFEHEIDLLATAGITRGCNPPTNTRFCPNDPVTRGQMAAFFVRAFGLSDAGDGDLFEDDDGHLFEREIDLLATAGITRGCNPPANTLFCPDDYVTRGQMAAFFHRAEGWLP